MANDSLIELARRKERLIARAAQQRAQIVVVSLKWRKPLSMADRGIAIAAYLKAHPLVSALAVAGVAAAGRASLPRWIGRGFFVWRLWRAAGVWMRGAGS